MSIGSGAGSLSLCDSPKPASKVPVVDGQSLKEGVAQDPRGVRLPDDKSLGPALQLLKQHLPDHPAKLAATYLVPTQETLALVAAGQVALQSLQDLAPMYRGQQHAWGKNIATELAAVAAGDDIDLSSFRERVSDYAAAASHHASDEDRTVAVYLLQSVTNRLTAERDSWHQEDYFTRLRMRDLSGRIRQCRNLSEEARAALSQLYSALDTSTPSEKVLALSPATRKIVLSALTDGISGKLHSPLELERVEERVHPHGYALLKAALDTLVPGWIPSSPADDKSVAAPQS